ncbi:MAG TPA: hypothetical protein VFE97_09140 [Methylomirabilota bacterium]|nr:hypothetical protein [Methylomirabilota bacterium]
MADRIAFLGREVRRVVLGVQDRPLRRELGEDRERAAIVVEIGDDEPVVRDQPLQARREFAEEALGIERIVHRSANGGQAGHEVGQNSARVVGGAHPNDDITSAPPD